MLMSNMSKLGNRARQQKETRVANGASDCEKTAQRFCCSKRRLFTADVYSSLVQWLKWKISNATEGLTGSGVCKEGSASHARQLGGLGDWEH